jgi:hypothetical protein
MLRYVGGPDGQLGAGVSAALDASARESATVAAFQDMFLMTALLFLLTVLPALFLTPPARAKRHG